MATPPREPQYEKDKITETLPNGTSRPIPWLGRFWEVLLPFFRDTTAALTKGLTIREHFNAFVTDAGSRPRITQPADGLLLNLFVETGTVRPALVFVVAEPVAEGGVPVDGLVQCIVEFMPSSQGGKQGVTLARLQGLTVGRRYDLAVTVLAG